MLVALKRTHCPKARSYEEKIAIPLMGIKKFIGNMSITINNEMLVLLFPAPFVGRTNMIFGCLPAPPAAAPDSPTPPSNLKRSNVHFLYLVIRKKKSFCLITLNGHARGSL